MALLTSAQHAVDEINIWSQLRHENIMPLLGITTKFDNTVSMVTEWMERGNAHRYVQNMAVDPRPLLLDIARGLNYLHDLSIVHGDIKGENVLISGTGRALITDFEFSYQSNLAPGLNADPPRGGTLRWLAPENLDTCAVSRQADIWAFGMTVLELFSRRYPYHGALTHLGIMSCILRGPPSRPSDESTNFRLCDKWWGVCTGCWNPSPPERLAMNDIVARIEEGNGSGGEEEKSGEEQWKRREGERREGSWKVGIRQDTAIFGL
ncbi:kinase-like domain-containing protein [Pisolithus thermaeus]|nr:kinase-like domain-containing protein [Pisolithus croceorrhizus]KAI6143848.1 kinase-like domain-containing protein [Pisolithus thermaeus]